MTNRCGSLARDFLGLDSSATCLNWHLHRIFHGIFERHLDAPLRMYKGNNWRSIGFAGSDIDGSVDDPEMLKKYESEAVQSLAEL